MKVIIHRPKIPQNTGNIVRTCSVTGAELILVRPLGFKTDDKSLKRAGLDYWENAKVSIIDDLMAYLDTLSAPFYFFSSKASTYYDKAFYPENALLIFGSEDSGLPQEYREQWPDRFLKIPMKKDSRCLNLSNAVAVALYEAQRQNQFPLGNEKLPCCKQK